MKDLSRHAQATREAIIEASLDLFVERRGADFSMQEVADRADVTHRTLYRYFPSRRDLLAEAAMNVGSRFRGPLSPEVSTVAEWIERAEDHFTFVEANREVFTSILSVVVEPPIASSGRSRDVYYWELFRNEFSDLPEDLAREWFAILRHLLSAFSYLMYRTRFGFDPSRAAAAVRRAAVAMVDEVAAANAKQGEKV